MIPWRVNWVSAQEALRMYETPDEKKRRRARNVRKKERQRVLVPQKPARFTLTALVRFIGMDSEIPNAKYTARSLGFRWKQVSKALRLARIARAIHARNLVEARAVVAHELPTGCQWTEGKKAWVWGPGDDAPHIAKGAEKRAVFAHEARHG